MNTDQYREIIDFAIGCEIDAQEFYKKVSRKVTQPYLREMFLKFAEEEVKHQKILEGIREDTGKSSVFDENRDYKVAESIRYPKVSDEMKPSDVFALAMKNEEMALLRYSGLAEGCQDPDLKKTFQDLASMERDHKFKMEKAFVDTAYPEDW